MLNRTTSRLQIELQIEKAHIHRARTTWNSIEQDVLATRQQITTSIENNLLLYKAILKPIWAYGVQLWSTVSNSSVEILQRFPNRYLGIITHYP